MKTSPRGAVHGGAVEAIARAYGRSPGALLDFSSNVNPLGPPAGVAAALHAAIDDGSALVRYPDAAQPALRALLAERTGVPREAVALGNGSAALLDAVLAALAPRRCIVPVPAFSEYAKALAARAITLVPFGLDAASDFVPDPDALVALARRERADLCILTNPHNPSGAVVPAPDAAALVERLAAAGCQAVLDEAFIDYVPQAQITARAVAGAPAVALRSLTKFYALPGMRVGYAVATPGLAAEIEASLPSWPVSTLAFVAARAALSASGFEAQAIATNAAARATLAAALEGLGLCVTPSAANFLLVDLSPRGIDADAARERLIVEHSIVVRACGDYLGLGSGFIRVAVRTESDNARLCAALAAVSH